jgi:hypothetical protein
MISKNQQKVLGLPEAQRPYLEALGDGEYGGRDPRLINSQEYADWGIYPAPLLAVIRANCAECVNGSVAEIRRCRAITCQFWPYRMGTNPFRQRVEMTPEQLEQRRRSIAKAREKNGRARPGKRQDC